MYIPSVIILNIDKLIHFVSSENEVPTSYLCDDNVTDAILGQSGRQNYTVLNVVL